MSNNIDLYSPEYTLQGLIEVGYIQKTDIDEILQGGATPSQVVQAIHEILLSE